MKKKIWIILVLVALFGTFFFVTRQGNHSEKEKGKLEAETVKAKIKTTANDYGETQAALNPEKLGSHNVQIETDKGRVVITLFPDAAPNAVKEFLTRVQEGYYDGTTFFDMQAGLGIVGGRKDPYPRQDFTDENNSLHSKPGSVGIAKSTLSKAYLNNIFIGFSSQPEIEKSYTIIGEVIEGLDLLEKTAPGLVMKSVKLYPEEKKS